MFGRAAHTDRRSSGHRWLERRYGRPLRARRWIRLALATAVTGLIAGALPATPAQAATSWPVINIPFYITQQPAAFSSWSTIESQAIAAVKELHQLRGDDVRVMAFARDEVRAAMFSQLIAIAKKPVDQRNANEQGALTTLQSLVKDQYVAVAQEAKLAWEQWNGNPCSWTVDAPDPIDQSAGFITSLATWCASPIAQQLAGPPSPPIEAFQAIGAWRVYGPVFASPEFQKLLPNTTLGIGFLGAMAVAGLAAGGASVAAVPFATGIATALGSSSINVAAAAGASATFAAGAAAAVVAAVILCIVGSVLEGIQVVNDAAIPGKLDDAITNATNNAPNIATDMGDSNKALAIFGVFLAQTLPEYKTADAYSDHPQVPFDATVDPTFQVREVATNAVTNSGVVTLDTWAPGPNGAPGPVTQEKVFLHDGWFVRQPVGGGQLTTSLMLPFVDADAKYKIAFMRGTSFVVTEVGTNGVMAALGSTDDIAVNSIRARAYLDGAAFPVAATLSLPHPVLGEIALPTSLVEGVPFTPTVSATDTGGSDLTYRWTLTRPCLIEICVGGTATDTYNGSTPSIVVPMAGSFPLTLTVRNESLATVTYQRTITVAKAIPTLSGVSMTANPDGRTVTVTGQVTHTGYAQSATVRVLWGDGTQSSKSFPDFGNGVVLISNDPIGTQPFSVTHTYDAHAANYPVDVVAQASNGMSSAKALTATVTASTVTVVGPSASVVVGEPLPELSPTVTGLPTGTDLTTPATCTTTRELDSAPGSYPVVCTGAAGPSNLTFDYTDGEVTVAKARTTLAVELADGAATAMVEVQAPGAGAPGGQVEFSVNAVPVGTAPVKSDGTATLPLALEPGATTVVATYSGDDSFVGSTASTAKTDPTLSAAASTTPNAAGWYRTPPTLDFTCTPGSAPLTGPCPDSTTLGEGADQTVSEAIAAEDGGVASVTLTGLNVDLTAPRIQVDGVSDGQDLLTPPATPLTCSATDDLSGVQGVCTVTTTRVARARAPQYRSTWEFTATATDRADNTTTVHGTYTVPAIHLVGASAGARDTVAVRPGVGYRVAVDLPKRKAPTLFAAVPARHGFTNRPKTRAAAFMRAPDGTWATTVRITRKMARGARYWNIGVRLEGQKKIRVITLDTGAR